MTAEKVSAESMRCLLECMLTVTLQVHSSDRPKLAVASLKSNEDLRRVALASCDSFLTWCRKLCVVAEMTDKSAPKMLESLHAGLRSLGYAELGFTFNGVKVDTKLMQSCQAVLRNMTPESEALLLRNST